MDEIIWRSMEVYNASKLKFIQVIETNFDQWIWFHWMIFQAELLYLDECEHIG
jgi:hypothetical protein